MARRAGAAAAHCAAAAARRLMDRLVEKGVADRQHFSTAILTACRDSDGAEPHR